MKTEKLVKSIKCDKCDQCGKEVFDNGEKYFGGSPFCGWIHLNIYNESTYIGDMNKKTDFDFCSMECLVSARDFVDYYKTENSFGVDLKL